MKSRGPKTVSPVEEDLPGEDSAEPKGGFPIVAIGASAGGLEAYSEFFRALPADTGMAFVLVQHLDPSHHSMLAEIIAKTTSLPVEEVKSGSRIKPGRVYVIPPNVLMVIADGTFKLTPRSKDPGQHLSVNIFMRSLAEDRTNRLIGIIFSGTGADGTLGLEEIKAAGGITFAQDPATAKHDGMPRSAIGSGCVDFVLSPKDIAKELDRIHRHPYVNLSLEPEPPPIESPEPQTGEFTTILQHLRRESGVDFSQYKPNTIHRRALRRMVILKLESLAEYANYLEQHPDERQKLYDDVLIPVTSFFRDFEAFEALKTRVYPAIVKDKGNKGSIRMWAPGCSTGEETYSLAMTLLEFLGDKASSFQVQIFGTDLNQRGIEKARAGIYRASIAEEISRERLSRFFVKVDEGYRVNKTVRDMCIFARQNLISDAPFSQMNLVACRNLLIYIQPVLQKKIIPILHYALKPSGFLVLGSSESVSAFPDLFSTVDKKQKIYAKRPKAYRLPYDFGMLYRPNGGGGALDRRGAAPPTAAAPEREIDLQAEADRLVLKNFAPVGVVINSTMEVVQFRGRTTPYLEPPPGKPSLNVLKLARNGLAVELRTLIGAAAKKNAPVKKDRISFESNGHKRVLNISVSPLGEKGSPEKRFFLILFTDVTPQSTPGRRKAPQPGAKAAAKDRQESKQLKQELSDAKEALRSAIESEDAMKEEFQSANEEILSANEELQSTNEELETSKEELQSANEELNTLNEELHNRNIELGHLNNDLANLLDAIRIPILFVGADLCLRRITSSAAEIFRVRPSDIGRPMSDIKHSLDVPDLAKLIEGTVSNLTTVQREVEDEQGRWRSLEIRPYRTAENRIEGAILALPAIDRLKHNEQYLKQIIDNVPNPLLVLDSDLKILLVNATFCSSFHVPQTETIGQLLYRLGNEQWNIPRLRELLEQILPHNKLVKDFVVTHDFEQIGRKTMLVSGRRIEDVFGGGPPMILLAIEDVTERKQVAESLEALTSRVEQQARTFDTMLSSISDFVYIFDREGRFLYANRPLLDLWGLRLEEAMGKNFFDLKYPEPIAERLQREIQEVFATGHRVSDETPYTAPSGTPGYYEYIFSPVFGAGGAVEFVAGSTRDLTEHKATEAALIKSEKLAAAGRLAATLAHEINNPLQAVMNVMSLLEKSPRLDAQDRTYAAIASEELRRVTHLTRQSLSFYRDNTSPTTVNVAQTLDEVLNLYAKQIETKGGAITRQYLSREPINSYPGEIRQIFTTLLVNALEASKTGCAITVRVRKSIHAKNPAIHGIRIMVVDHGVGIPDRNKTHVFEPFFTTKGEQGTGLGLWVTQGIVSRLGGSIRVRSSVRPARSGTCFSIFLPKRLPNSD